ncbi:glycerophosphodiester phosphodiesterase domain-containing protein 5-like isoform X2 [Acanthaster planci]|uniref:Glycerophosphodiester phosphodiesterase domain-containing protein 5-like isoform X2 n=1 Tax=Acanthaster planci TaxID=133434 RepID=A0A8B7YRR6_ACAPL|nr:glycerophosphodiester phosphodiesterase domain-containing protein 5-like isoform X2 [Acanthaster planci]XP_022095160.1 glycerophosphodiester phosphodiesterase domain-containing protein 5-like isoform X2 [Acanthaster planci]
MTTCRGCWASLVTGCYGCRTRKDVENKEATKLTERLWFIFVLLVSFTSLANMFFWLAAVNDSSDFNRDLAEMTGLWWRYYIFFMALSCALSSYAVLLLMFAFLHIAIGQKLQLHGAHKIGLILDLSLSVALLVFPCAVLGSSSLWHFLPQALQFTGPFLHLVGVVIMTGLSWFVAGGMGTLQRKGIPVRDVALWYFLVLIGLYISPVFIRSPCLLKYDELPPKPLVFAYRGAEQLAPENTLIAFELSLDVYNAQGIHTDVRVSYDGEPYIMRDDKLTRTTNVEDVFPERYADHSDSFTLAELKQLNAGSWFITCNPFGTTSRLTELEIIRYRKQKIPTLREMLLQVKGRNKTVLLDVRTPPDDHPYSEDWLNITLQVILDSGVAEEDVSFWKAPNNDTKYTFAINTFDERRLMTTYNDIPFFQIRSDAALNVTTNVWTVNEDWLFSLFWCAGATSISTSSCQRVRIGDGPLWQLSPLHYRIMWILFDVVSFIWVIIIFIIQISSKLRNKPAQPHEMVSLVAVTDHVECDTRTELGACNA